MVEYALDIGRPVRQQFFKRGPGTSSRYVLNPDGDLARLFEHLQVQNPHGNSFVCYFREGQCTVVLFPGLCPHTKEPIEVRIPYSLGHPEGNKITVIGPSGLQLRSLLESFDPDRKPAPAAAAKAAPAFTASVAAPATAPTAETVITIPSHTLNLGRPVVQVIQSDVRTREVMLFQGIPYCFPVGNTHAISQQSRHTSIAYAELDAAGDIHLLSVSTYEAMCLLGSEHL